MESCELIFNYKKLSGKATMENKREEIKNYQVLILKRLEEIELRLDKQEEEIKAYKLQNPRNLNTHALLATSLKSTRTSFCLLRDEIEEIESLILDIIKGKEK